LTVDFRASNLKIAGPSPAGSNQPQNPGHYAVATSESKSKAQSSDNSVVRPASDIIARRLGASAVLIRMRTSRIYELNETGARIWELLKQHATRESAVDGILAEFQIGRADAEAAVDELIVMLRAEGLL